MAAWRLSAVSNRARRVLRQLLSRLEMDLPPDASRWLIGIGVVCLLGAVTAQGVKAFGLELGGVASPGRQVILFLLGLGAILAGLRSHTHKGLPQDPLTSAEAAATLTVPGSRPRPTPRFTGHSSTLAKLHSCLRSEHIVALTGLAGVGKTQLALVHAQRHERDYDLVWWIRAGQAASLARDYGAIASAVGLGDHSHQAHADAVMTARRWLEEHGRWLLIFDDAERYQAIERYLPSNRSGDIIITSRDALWRDTPRVPVNPWSRPESLEFLRHVQPFDETAASDLAEALGDLPLALEQALAYMTQTRMGIPDYHRLLRERSPDLVREGDPFSYEQRVATTWTVSLERIARETPAARDLLDVAAFLAPDDIPRALFTDHVQILPRRLRATVSDAIAYNQVITALGRFSLVDTRSDVLSIHRLVQAAVRQRPGTRSERSWAAVAVRLLRVAFPANSADASARPECARLLPHALSAAYNAERVGVELNAVAWLLDHLGVYLQAAGEYQHARELSSRAVTIAEALYGPNHAELAVLLNHLGRTLRNLDELSEGRSTLERALAIAEAEYGKEHPYVAAILNQLGRTLRCLGSLPQAKAYIARALAINEATHGHEHPYVALTLNNLGRVLEESGDRDGAIAAYRRALKIARAVRGPRHADTAAILNNLGRMLAQLGDLKGARGRGLLSGGVGDRRAGSWTTASAHHAAADPPRDGCGR